MISRYKELSIYDFNNILADSIIEVTDRNFVNDLKVLDLLEEIAKVAERKFLNFEDKGE